MTITAARVLWLALCGLWLLGAQPRPHALATVALTSGWATFGLALPQGAATGPLAVGPLPTQTDIKVRWPDGSIRFAVISTHAASDGSHPITTGGRASPAFAAVVPETTVTITVNGTPYTATLPRTGGDDRWLDGPLVVERRAAMRLGPLPSMGVIFDVRSYAGGGHRVDITVENTLDVAGADAMTYDVAIRTGSSPAPVFEQRGVRHPYLTRWRKVVFVDGAREARATVEMTPFIEARALPEYSPTVSSASPGLDGRGRSGTGFGLLAFGDLTLPMNAHGGRPELAPYPDFAARYLAHRTPAHLAYLLRHGELAASWAMHVRKADGGLPTIDEFPAYWLDARWRNEDGFQGPVSARQRADGGVEIAGQGEPADLAHQPSLAFVPYLVTGDRFFADEVAFWANFTLLGSYPPPWARDGSRGLLWNNEVRGIGWALRNLGDAAAYLPDGWPIKAHFAAKTAVNLDHLDHYGRTFASGPLSTVFTGRRPEDRQAVNGQHLAWIALWEQAYVAWAIDRVMNHGVVAGFNFMARGHALRDRIARTVLPLFTHPDWPRNHNLQMPYLLAVGVWNGPPQAEHSTVRFFSTWAEVRDATFCCAAPSARLPPMARPFQGYYGPEARLLLLLLEGGGERAAAAEALAQLMSDVGDDGVTTIDDLNARAGWAVLPRRFP